MVVGVGRGDMRVIVTPLVMKVRTAVAGTVFEFEAFVAGPDLDQRLVHRKMFIRQQRLNLGMAQ